MNVQAEHLGRPPPKAHDVRHHAPERWREQVTALRKDGTKTVAAPLKRTAVQGQRERHLALASVDSQDLKEAHQVGVRREVEDLLIS